MYITYDELILRYPIIETWNNSQTNVENDLIYYAERELNSRLASHFSVPFSGSHPTVKDLSLDLAYYKALYTKDPGKAKDIKDAVIGRIEDIKEGKEYIVTDSYTTIPPNANTTMPIWSTTMDYHPVHSMLGAEDALTGIDSDYIDDLEGERT